MAETLRELVVSLSLSSDDFSKNIRATNNQIKETESRFAAAGAGVENFGKSVEGQAAKAQMLTEKLRAQSQNVESYRQALEKANATLERNGQKNQELAGKLEASKKSQANLSAEVQRAETLLKSAEKAYGKNSAAANNARENLEDLKEQEKAAAAEIKGLEGQITAQNKTLQGNADAVTKATDSLNRAEAAEKTTRAELEKVNQSIKTHALQWTNAAEKMEQFGNRAIAVGNNLTTVGRNLSTYVTAPILALGTASVVAYAQLDTAARKVTTVADTTVLSLEDIKAGVREISSETGEAATDIAAGLYDLISANGDTANSLTNMSIATKAAVGGFAEQSVAVDGLTTVMNAYGLTGSDAMQRVSDQMLTAQNYGKTTFGAIASSIGDVIPLAAQFKTETEDLFSNLAVLTKQGIDTSSAMTGLKAVYSNVLKPSADAEDAAKRLGLDFSAAALEAKGLGGFIADITDKTGGSVEELSALFGSVEALNTVLALTSDAGQKDYASAMAAMQSSSGATERAYQTMTGGIEGATKRAQATVANFGSLLGEDLAPALNEVVDAASGWLEQLTAMDEGQRKAMLTAAAWIAGIGPGIMILGKLNTGVGNIALKFGDMTKSAVAAGGGLKGVLSACGNLLGPVGIAALAAAALYGAYKWYDYASGAAAAREATEAMIETAKEWQNTQAKTIYDTGNDAFARFGLDNTSFASSIQESEDWVNRLIATWTDGKAETNQIVKDYVDEFTAGSDEIRTAIEARKEAQAALGASDVVNDENIAKLKSYDDEITALLKKRQNGFLTDEEKARLSEVIDLRADIEVQYKTGDGSGYDTILKGIEAEKARIAGEGGTVGVDLYTDALKAGAQGYATQVDALNESYRKQYEVVQSITDEKQKEIALTTLNEQHQQALNAAQNEYNDLVAQVTPNVYNSDEIQQAAADMQALKDSIADLQGGRITATAFEEFTKTLDEGKLASYITLLKQMQGSDLGSFDLGNGLTPDSLLGGYETVGEYLEAHAGTLTGINDMLKAAGEEADRILVEMQLTPDGQALKDQLDEWVANGIDVSTIATISGYVQETDEAMTIQNVNINSETGDITGYNQATGEAIHITGVNINPETGEITGYNQATGEPIKISGVKLLDETGTIVKYVQASNVITPIAKVTAKLAYEDFTGIEQTAIENYFASNPDKKPSMLMNIGYQTGWATTLQQRFDAGTAVVFGPDGARLNVTPELIKQIGPTDVFLGSETDENGIETFYYQILPKMGTQEAVDYATDNLEEKPSWNLDWLFGKGDSTNDKVKLINESADALAAYKARIDELKASGQDASRIETDLATAETDILNTFMAMRPEELSKIGEAIASIIAAAQTGELTKDDALQMLEPFQAVIDSADALLGIGNDVSAGVAGGMKAYDWSGDSATLASDIDTALRAATGSHSPATKYIPVGMDIARGVARGIDNGTYIVKGAMVRMARAALAAAKLELKIESPSRVMQDEVGAMITRGAAQGVLKETQEQKAAIANAFRQLVSPALQNASTSTNVDNSRRTVIHEGGFTIQGGQYFIRDQNDIRALAMEYAYYARRENAGKGARP